MTGACFAIGFLVGFLACRWFVSWPGLWRSCCVEHYRTHPTCSCADCHNERYAR